MSSLWTLEARLFLRQRLALPALLLMAILSIFSVWAGMTEMSRQRDIIARIQPQQAADVASIAKWVSKEGDAGNAAYYTFHATWDAPSALAFAAIGQRDVAPYILRVRALGLEAQLYESENYNAELALPGRFDWAFVLTYIAPLLVIILLHDLKSGEREAGRFNLLAAMARSERGLWRRRIVLRLGALWLMLVLPFAVGAMISGAHIGGIAIFFLVSAAYLVFWTLLCLWIGSRGWSSVTNAATLAASWLVLTLILPAMAHLAINMVVPVRQGVELTLAQREKIHGGWDRPKAETMQAFFKVHPEWKDTKPVEGGFHWKWYYAFQHLGDLAAGDQAKAYRAGLERRDSLTVRTGVLLPAVGVQTLLHRVAKTDMRAGLAYQDRIRIYHERLRRFYYPYLFNETPFREAEFAKTPKWD
jgi:ABC-2 type transport system permease protein